VAGKAFGGKFGATIFLFFFQVWFPFATWEYAQTHVQQFGRRQPKRTHRYTHQFLSERHRFTLRLAQVVGRKSGFTRETFRFEFSAAFAIIIPFHIEVVAAAILNGDTLWGHKERVAVASGFARLFLPFAA
jgi:hypothetical protein